jgi:hypothetical protein
VGGGEEEVEAGEGAEVEVSGAGEEDEEETGEGAEVEIKGGSEELSAVGWHRVRMISVA